MKMHRTKNKRESEQEREKREEREAKKREGDAEGENTRPEFSLVPLLLGNIFSLWDVWMVCTAPLAAVHELRFTLNLLLSGCF